MFLAWFEVNKKYVDERNLTYAEFSSKFVWIAQQRQWKLRMQGYNIGRLTHVPPGCGEHYYMRILLNIQKGCVDYASIRTVNKQTFNTYEEACYALEVLKDDKEFINAIKEASELASSHELRRLFVSLLFINIMSKLKVVWKASWKLMLDEILYQKRKDLRLVVIEFLKCYN